MRSICGLEQQLNPNFDNDIVDLRIVEYGFNYFFPLFQQSKFGISHRIDPHEFLNFFLGRICGDIGEHSYPVFGYGIEYIRQCNTCKFEKKENDDTAGDSYNQILNVPLPYASENIKSFQLKKLFKDMFKENTIEDYTCQSCKQNGLTMTQRQQFTRLPEVMVLSIQRKIPDSNEVDRRPVVISKTLEIGRKDYHLRSIVYHEGSDEKVNGHHSCHCLMKCKPANQRRGSALQFWQWFYFDDGAPNPITADKAINSPVVKKGCVLMFYQKNLYNVVDDQNFETRWKSSRSLRYKRHVS